MNGNNVKHLGKLAAKGERQLGVDSINGVSTTLS